MKKFLVLALALVCVLGVLPVSALTKNGSFGDVPLYKGTITIDGKKDAIYDKALKINTAPHSDSTKGDSSAVVSLLHDGSNLYVLVECKSAYALGDYNESYKDSNAWKTTGIEIITDWTNAAAGQNDCYKYKSWFTSDIWFSLKAAKDDVEFKATVDKAAKTFIMEYKFKFLAGAKTGSEIGFNLMFDSDKTMGAKSDATRTIASILPGVDNNGSQFKNITLSSKEVKAEVATTAATTAAAKTTTTTKTTTAAKTADASVVVAVVSVVALAGIVVAKKRK